MNVYISNPDNSDARALLNKYGQECPMVGGLLGAKIAMVWAFLSGIAMNLFWFVAHSSEGLFVALVSALLGLIWAVVEYEPGRRRDLGRFDQFLAAGEIIWVPDVLLVALLNQRRRDLRGYSEYGILQHSYTEVQAFGQALREIYAGGNVLNKDAQASITAAATELANQCIASFRNALAERATHRETEQGLHADWVRDRLGQRLPEL